MRMKTVVKLGTILSVLLFALAVGYYAFMRLDIKKHNREIDLYSLVPSTCVGVLESDDINDFFIEYSTLSYSRELAGFHFSGLFDFLVGQLNDYTRENAHGLSNQMSRLLVSFHQMGATREQVVYFHLGMTDEYVLSDMLQEYMPTNFLPKEEEYRGKKMLIYPLSHNEFLTTFTEKGFVVLSYQKCLVEEVIDAWLDDTSLSFDEVFSDILKKKKSHASLTLYGRGGTMPFWKMGPDCWTEYDFHMNSDVAYLTGDTYTSDDSAWMEKMSECLENVPVLKEEGLILSARKDSTVLYMNQAFEANDNGDRTLFNQCVANLATEVAFTFVLDMQRVQKEPELFWMYLPAFVLENAPLFRPFILSIQIGLNGDRASHMWTFTYKH